MKKMPEIEWDRESIEEIKKRKKRFREKEYNEPCRDCGRDDLPLFEDHRCPECHK